MPNLALPHVRRQNLHGLMSMAQLKMKIFLGIVLEVTELVLNIENDCTGKGKKGSDIKYTKIIVEETVKKIICQCTKKNTSHVVKVFADHILREFVIHVYSDILYLYIVFGDKGYLRKGNCSFIDMDKL